MKPLQLYLYSLNRVLVEELLQILCFACVVVVEQENVEPLHVLVGDGHDSRAAHEQDLVCHGQARALVAVPKELPARPIQRLLTPFRLRLCLCS